MIKATNLTRPEVISIHAETGELSLLGSLNITAAPYGATRFEVIIQATDFGEPRLASEIPLIIRLKVRTFVNEVKYGLFLNCRYSVCWHAHFSLC